MQAHLISTYIKSERDCITQIVEVTYISLHIRAKPFLVALRTVCGLCDPLQRCKCKLLICTCLIHDHSEVRHIRVLLMVAFNYTTLKLRAQFVHLTLNYARSMDEKMSTLRNK